WRDRPHHETSVLLASGTSCEPPLHEPIEQPGDVRIPPDQSLCDVTAGEPVVTGARQDSQAVVLGEGEIVTLEQIRFGSAQYIGGAHEIQEDALAPIREGSTLFDLALQKLAHGGY